MTEKQGHYHQDDGHPFNKPKSQSHSEIIAKSFIDGVQAFHWKADFIKFCEILELEADDYAERQYRAFQELVERLNEFNSEALAKMIDWGNPKGDS